MLTYIAEVYFNLVAVYCLVCLPMITRCTCECKGSLHRQHIFGSALSTCSFISAAYRFFPLLLLFSIILIVLLNRDFGPLLTAERNVAALSLTVKSPESVGEHKKRSLKKNVLCVDQVDHDINMGNEQAVLEMRGSVLNTNMTSDIDAYIGMCIHTL